MGFKRRGGNINMNKKERIRNQVENIILDLVRQYKHNDHITNSDLQGIVSVKTVEIYNLFKQPETKYIVIVMYGGNYDTTLQFNTHKEAKTYVTNEILTDYESIDEYNESIASTCGKNMFEYVIDTLEPDRHHKL